MILDVTGTCQKMSFILRIVARIVYYLHIIIPMLLIVLIVFDFVKVIIGGADDKAKKDAAGKVAKRFCYALIVFLIPTVINIAFDALDSSIDSSNYEASPTSWMSCWTAAYKGKLSGSSNSSGVQKSTEYVCWCNTDFSDCSWSITSNNCTRSQSGGRCKKVANINSKQECQNQIKK